jgi:hypothetical protein
MVQRGNVVPETTDVSEAQFMAAMVAGLARAEKNVGTKALAFTMDVTVKQLGNILAGAATHPKRLWDALAADDTAMADIADLYGKRLVAKEAVCDVDDASVLITRLLLWLHEAQHPNSPGGRNIVHTELLPAEFMIRQLHQATGNWLGQISNHRESTACSTR